MNCPICASSSTDRKTAVGTREVFFCRACGTGFLHPLPSEADTTALYSETYYKAWGISGDHEDANTRQLKIATFGRYLDAIAPLKHSGALLDIGCATGFLLEEAAMRGFEPYGIEVSAFSSRLAQKKFGVRNIFNGTVEGCSFPEGFFDVIVMSDLIEHTRDPLQTLHRVKALLKENGIILMITPDSTSGIARLMRNSWFNFKEEHLYYFNRRALDYLLLQAGLQARTYRRAVKVFTWEYIHHQFITYPHWLITPLLSVINGILPRWLKTRCFAVRSDEIVAVIERPHTPTIS